LERSTRTKREKRSIVLYRKRAIDAKGSSPGAQRGAGRGQKSAVEKIELSAAAAACWAREKA